MGRLLRAVKEILQKQQGCGQCARCGIWSRTDRCPQCGAHKASVEAVQAKAEARIDEKRLA